MNAFEQNIHNQALDLASQYLKVDGGLISVLQSVDKYKIFSTLGYTSLFQYCLHALKLSESQSFNLIGVARKSKEVPELKAAIVEGKITLSNARRIVSVITPENKSQWIEKAEALSQKSLEFEVVKLNPKAVTRESIKPIVEDRSELKTFISKNLESDLRKVQNILSQKLKRHATLEEVITATTQEYLTRHDPVQKAELSMKRIENKKANKPVSVQTTELCLRRVESKKATQVNKPIDPQSNINKRVPIPAQIKHQVVLRDQNQCSFKMPDGKRCDLKRWTHLHHIKPVAQGGLNEVNNLQTLCFYHHRLAHS